MKRRNKALFEDEGATASPPPQPSPACLQSLTDTMQQWPPALVLKRFLGRGSFGEVYEAIDSSHGNERVAVKRMRDVFSSRRAADARRIYREIWILRHLRHPNVCSLLDVVCPGLETSPPETASPGAGAGKAPGSPPSKRARSQGPAAASTPRCTSTRGISISSSSSTPSSTSSTSSSTPSSATLVQQLSDLFLVFEYVDTDLMQLLQSPQFLSPAHVRFMLYQILLGVQCLADAHVIHRDLKPANVLINENCTLKLCDFGMARILKPMPPVNINMNTSSSTGSTTASSSSGDAASPDPRGVQLRRQLTQHVATRWYRAPELILLCPNYTSAVDVWSVGCIFAELLGMERASVPHCSQRSALFPGSSCFPMSGDGTGGRETAAQHGDQLGVIFSVIGSPSEQEVCEVASPAAQAWLRSQPRLPRTDLSLRLPGAAPEALDLLQRLLAFSPSRRISVHEALAHPYLAGMRVPVHGWAEPACAPLPFADADADAECELDEERLLCKVVDEIAAFRAANAHDEDDDDDDVDDVDVDVDSE